MPDGHRSWYTHRFVTGVAAAAVIVGLALSPLGSVVLDAVAPATTGGDEVDPDTLVAETASDPPPPGTNPADVLPPPDEPDQLAAPDGDHLRTILNSSTTFQGLLGSRTYTVDESGPWTDSGTLSGAIAHVSFSQAVTRNDIWLPGVRFSQDDASYQVLSLHMAFTGVTDFDVDVDFDTNRVVGISPQPESAITALPGNPSFPVDDVD
jgi:hypothetical protein